jgi:glycosyltransferase involved in cell wall biosynthesis
MTDMNTPRRVLFFESSPGFGGSIVVLGRLVKHLDPQRYVAHAVVSHPLHRDHLAAFMPAESILVDSVRMHTFHSGMGRAVAATVGRCGHAGHRLATAAVLAMNLAGPARSFARRVQRSFGSTRFDAVWQNNGVGSNVGAAGLLARRWNVPFICKPQGFEWISPRTKWLAQFVDMFAPDSEAVANHIRAMNVPRERIKVTYCPIDVRQFDPARVLPTGEFRSPGGASARPASFGIVGQLLKWKGQHVFLEAAKRVFATCPESVAVIIGREPDRSGERMRYLQELAARLGIADKVRFTGHRDDTPQVLAELDVVVHASIEPEPFGTVVAEAMAMKRPVVAMRAGGPPEYVEDGSNGLLCDPGNPDQMAKAITRLLADADLRSRLGENGRKTVLERFSAERHARDTQELLDAVIASPMRRKQHESIAP